MGIYKEKKEQLIEKIKVYEARIASDTAKKKAAEEKLRASGLSDADLLELVGIKNAVSEIPSDSDTADTNLENAALFANSFLHKSDYCSDND